MAEQMNELKPGNLPKRVYKLNITFEEMINDFLLTQVEREARDQQLEEEYKKNQQLYEESDAYRRKQNDNDKRIRKNLERERKQNNLECKQHKLEYERERQQRRFQRFDSKTISMNKREKKRLRRLTKIFHQEDRRLVNELKIIEKKLKEYQDDDNDDDDYCYLCNPELTRYDNHYGMNDIDDEYICHHCTEMGESYDEENEVEILTQIPKTNKQRSIWVNKIPYYKRMHTRKLTHKDRIRFFRR